MVNPKQKKSVKVNTAMSEDSGKFVKAKYDFKNRENLSQSLTKYLSTLHKVKMDLLFNLRWTYFYAF